MKKIPLLDSCRIKNVPQKFQEDISESRQVLEYSLLEINAALEASAKSKYGGPFRDWH